MQITLFPNCINNNITTSANNADLLEHNNIIVDQSEFPEGYESDTEICDNEDNNTARALTTFEECFASAYVSDHINDDIDFEEGRKKIIANLSNDNNNKKKCDNDGNPITIRKKRAGMNSFDKHYSAHLASLSKEK